MVKIATKYSMTIYSCCESKEYSKIRINVNGCQTQDLMEKIIGASLNIPHKENVRKTCNCLLGNDIGQYNTCMHLCKYYYANSNEKLVIENNKNHDLNSPLLIGKITNEDIIKEAKQKSYISNQLTLF